ncbi:nuclear transport factor 2 family protein [Nocardioides mangrovicus]|uniref:nuclear transport factor 2 family protein n=1 Tax=Nocardioides mangrovicus TaxID=2478913 RepID=UPI001314F9B7|nr:nuclear transport factor 2 family protein [Nocardioides mangrovicus]
MREFYACYFEGRPDDLERCVSEDYTDHGHTPPGRGPAGVRADYDQAVAKVGGLVAYVIDALVVDDDEVAAVWTGTLPDGGSMRGLSLYRVREGLIASTHHTLLAS